MNCIKRSISPQNSGWIPKQPLCKKWWKIVSCVRKFAKIHLILLLAAHLRDEFSSFQLLEIQDDPMWWDANCQCSNYKLSCLRISSRLASMRPPPSNLWPAKNKIWFCTLNNSTLAQFFVYTGPLCLTISTGIKSAMLSSLHIIVWKIPFPTAETMPVGPFQLSTQPLYVQAKIKSKKKLFSL